MNILAIDYGSKNVGLAWVDTDLGVVLPYGVMRPQSLIDVIKRERADEIVIGLPIGLDGKENKNTETVRAFADQLRSAVGLPIHFIDERFTSAEADRMGNDGASRDEKAAMIILQLYLDKRPKQ